MTLHREKDIDQAYQRLFERDSGATVFHHPAWLKAARTLFKGDLEIWWLDDRVACPFTVSKKGLYTGVYSGSYGCYGGPIGDQELFEDFLGQVASQGLERIEIVDFSNRISHPDFRRINRTAHMVELPEDPRELGKVYSQLRKRDLKRGDVEVVVGGDVREFFNLHRATYSSAKVWFAPLEGIKAVLDTGLARLYTGLADQKTVAGMLVLIWKDTWMWWINGWDKSYAHISPMTHLLHAAMTDACRAGARFFNMGGTDAKGPGRFKESMGARVREYGSVIKEKPWVRTLRAIKERLR